MSIEELEVTLKMMEIVNFRFSDCLIIIFNDNNFNECENIIKNILLDNFYYEQNPDDKNQIIVAIGKE